MYIKNNTIIKQFLLYKKSTFKNDEEPLYIFHFIT